MFARFLHYELMSVWARLSELRTSFLCVGMTNGEQPYCNVGTKVKPCFTCERHLCGRCKFTTAMIDSVGFLYVGYAVYL